MKLLLRTFTSSWCGTCKKQIELLQSNPIDFVTLQISDIEEDSSIPELSDIDTLPATILYDNNTEIKRWVGLTQPSVINQFIISYMEEKCL